MSSAADKTLKATKTKLDSPTLGEVIAPGATLINTSTGNGVIYNVNDNPVVNPPFDIEKGYIFKGFGLMNSKYETVTLGEVTVVEGQGLVIDFSTYYTGGGLGLGGPVDSEYTVILFDDNNFAEWYAANPVTITGKFTNGDYLGYVITNACDQYDAWGVNAASTNGGLVFFNHSVAPMVLAAEIALVPEPTTATLSLLALAGLAMRRRRRA